MRELKFNSTAGRCEHPLVQTYRPEAYHYPNFEGCDLQCYDPMFSIDEHRQIHNLIAWTATIAGLCNIFAIVSTLKVHLYFIDFLISLILFSAYVYDRMAIIKSIS